MRKLLHQLIDEIGKKMDALRNLIASNEIKDQDTAQNWLSGRATVFGGKFLPNVEAMSFIGALELSDPLREQLKITITPNLATEFDAPIIDELIEWFFTECTDYIPARCLHTIIESQNDYCGSQTELCEHLCSIYLSAKKTGKNNFWFSKILNYLIFPDMKIGFELFLEIVERFNITNTEVISYIFIYCIDECEGTIFQQMKDIISFEFENKTYNLDAFASKMIFNETSLAITPPHEYHELHHYLKDLISK